MEINEESSLLDKNQYDDASEIWNAREMWLFLIDCSKEMYGKDENYFQLCLECCKNVLLNRIIAGSNDLIGIVFFGVEKKDPGDQNHETIFTFATPNLPSAEIIKSINNLLDLTGRGDFESQYGHSSKFSIADALWHCSTLITKCSKKVNFSTILLMTCHDNPHKDSLIHQYQARKRASDLAGAGIKLQLIHLGPNFDVNVFYKDLLHDINSSDNYVPYILTEKKKEELFERINRRHYKKRAVVKIDFNLGNGVSIPVEIYNFYRRLVVPPVTKLNRKTNEILKSTYHAIHSETGEQMLPSDLNKYQTVAGKRISFTKNEIVQLSNISEPGLTLFGFKNLDHLGPELYYRPSSFLYPTGNKELFIELLEQCISKSKFALCCLVPRSKGNPYFVALVPQKEQYDEDGVQTLPTGFHIIYIPYAEHIRDLKSELGEASEIGEHTPNLFDKVVKSLTLKTKYTPKFFENPKIQNHWANVEALALNTDREINDETYQDLEEISKRLRSVENEFKKWIKDMEPANSASGIDDSVIQQAAFEKDLNRFSIPILKKYLEYKVVDLQGKRKKDLVDAIYKHLNIDPND